MYALGTIIARLAVRLGDILESALPLGCPFRPPLRREYFQGPPWQLEEHLGKAGCDNASGLQRSPHLVFVVVGVEKSGALCR